MNKAELKSFGKPEEVREFPKGRVDLLTIGGATVGRATFEPGWKWSNLRPAHRQDEKLRSPAFPVSRVRRSDGPDG